MCATDEEVKAEIEALQPGGGPGLYVVATPIGNLGDLSPRARDTLANASLVAAEDTRTTLAVLPRTGKRPPTTSLTEHNVRHKIAEVLSAAREGTVALVSEAGTPALADPGGRLVEAAHRQGIPVFVVPGPSAPAAAVSASGFDGSDFHFLGFLPRQAAARVARLRAAVASASTVVFLESPNRLPRTLSEIAAELDDPETAVCRELTKVHEETRRDRASALATHFAAGTRGECTVVLRSPGRRAEHERAKRLMAAMEAAGARRAAAAAEVARETGVSRREAYALWPEADPEPADGL